MTCHNCGEKFSIKDYLLILIRRYTPEAWHNYLDARQETKQLMLLGKLAIKNTEVLTDRELYVVQGRLCGLSYEEIAKDMQVTNERIRQIQAKALRKLVASERS